MIIVLKEEWVTKMTISANKSSIQPIPQPQTLPMLGNLLTVEASAPVQDMMRLAREYGPIFQLDLPGRKLVVVSGFDLVDELSDEKRFDKKVWSPLKGVRAFAGDGLFTAQTQEPNWSKAHNILLPNFSQKAMQSYHPMMLDIAEQLALKWERLNPEDEIDVVGDMTRLTLDTIGLCGFDYRFNSFYREDMHPFVNAMVEDLEEALGRLHRLPVQNKIRVESQRKFQANVDLMNNTVDRVIKEQRESGEDLSGKKDLLSYMLAGVDKKSGERLSDENIRYQVITFLIAGHETTSGLLSFALYEITRHPEMLAKAYEEVDRVFGPDSNVKPTYAQVNQLTYIQANLKEALRLYPTAPLFALYPYEDTVIGGKYEVKKDYELAVLISMLHRDKSVWGEDAELFNPDNFTREAEAKRPANAYKPFGNGQRACIGRQFAMQEATLVLGMLLHRFRLIDHNRYQLKIKETLTLKPSGFKIRVRTRKDHKLFENSAVVAHTQPAQTATRVVPQHGTPLLVLFGSNLGTAEEIARQIGQSGEDNGFATTVAPMDDYTEKLPKEGAVVFVTASYNGTPPDNSVKFCDWLQNGNLSPTSLKGVNYAVFGCGNRDWAATFQSIPRLVDSKLEEYGAHRIYQRGEGDASDDFDGQFQNWYGSLWTTVAQELKIDLGETEKAEQLYKIEVVNPALQVSNFVSSYGANAMTVLENRELHTKDGACPSERSTRHIEIRLPEGVTYKAGNHLGVLPRNSEVLVKRVADRFGFDHESFIKLHKTNNRKTLLPLDETISVYRLLADYVELQDVATRKQIKTLADHTECPPEKMKLLDLCGDDEKSATVYKDEVMAKRKSMIDLLEECPACTLPFEVYLEMLSALRPRYYSISSSPLQQPNVCSLTVAVVGGTARSGHGEFEGTCSNYLLQQEKGDTIYAFVRDTGTSFSLPEDTATPLIMVGPGTGLAPFRGFLQERAAQKTEGKNVGTSLLFFGCRHPQQDFIYEAELRDYTEQSLTNLCPAFSRYDNQPKSYVQDVISGAAKEEVWQLIEQGATIYICGDASKMAPAVRQAFAAIYQEKTGATAETATEWLNQLTAQKRYQVDVWASN